ncbi:hypothetical protein GVN24_21830 [Rhizobium sp. CRIBSB]|nr:hypothetical protein [Rhizobium sp. CRIBSB]
MKRHKPASLRQVLAASLILGLPLAGCGSPEDGKTTPSATAQSDWIMSPVIEAVERAPDSLIFSGRGQPSGRIVLRGTDGIAFAAVADSSGRFDIRMAVPDGSMLLEPEAQVGQDAAPSPQRILIIDGGRGPIVLLKPGSASRRLDDAPVLAAVDADSRGILLSGRAAPGEEMRIAISDRPALMLIAGRDGRWTATLDGSGARTIRVNDQSFAYPGASGDVQRKAVRAGTGWRMRWEMADGAAQEVWLPDR